jgi:undecaprenyl-diphosphatase
VTARQGWLWPVSGRVVIGALVTLAILAGAMVLIDGWAINEARGLPRWVHVTFREITDFGKSGWFLWPIGLALVGLAVAAPLLDDRMASAVVAAVAVRLSFVFAAIAVPGLVVAIIKRLIGRARPFVTGEADPFAYQLLVWRSDFASLPSGHSTTAFAAALAIGALWPRARVALWIYALVIALSRVVVTAHHPSDVLAGAVFGTIGALLVRDWFAARGLVFTVDPQGRTIALPGPSWQRIKRVARRVFGQ